MEKPDKKKLYERIKIPYAEYQRYAWIPGVNLEQDVHFYYDRGVSEVLLEISPKSSTEDLETFNEWYDHANVIIIEEKKSWAADFVPDMFLFNYHFKKGFRKADYEFIKEKHPRIIINLPYSMVSSCNFWNSEGLDLSNDTYNYNSVELPPPPIKQKRHDYKRSILGKIPSFLWETDCIFMISEHHEMTSSYLYYEILWLIHDLETRVGVDPGRFILADCNMMEKDHRIEVFYESFPQLKRRVNSKPFPRFEALTSVYYSGYYYLMEHGKGRVPGQVDFDLERRRKKKFLFLNRSGREHRNALIIELNNEDLLFDEDNFYFSYGESKKVKHSKTIKEIVKNYDDDSLKKLNAFTEGIPYFLDTSDIKTNWGVRTPDTYFGPTGDTLEILGYVQDSYFNLIAETSISSDFLFLTEKTFKCMAWKQPFIIWGNPHSLRHLQEMGYKTFHPWINEEYDDVMDPLLRLEVICKEVKRICNMDLEEIHKIYRKLIPILKHNYDHFNYQKIIRRNFDYSIKKLLPPRPPT